VISFIRDPLVSTTPWFVMIFYRIKRRHGTDAGDLAYRKLEVYFAYQKIQTMAMPKIRDLFSLK
jgi:hypothetical protein